MARSGSIPMIAPPPSTALPPTAALRKNAARVSPVTAASASRIAPSASTWSSSKTGFILCLPEFGVSAGGRYDPADGADHPGVRRATSGAGLEALTRQPVDGADE